MFPKNPSTLNRSPRLNRSLPLHPSILNDLIYWVAVSHLQTVKLAKLRAWLEVMSTFQNLFAAGVEDLKEFGFTTAEIEKIKSPNWFTLEAELKWYETKGS